MATKSIFYEYATRPISFTFLMAEALATKQEHMRDHPEGYEGVSFGDILKEVSAIRGEAEPTLAQLEYLVSRIQGDSIAFDEKTKKPKALKANKDFAGSLSEWISGLTADQVCLWLVDYNFAEAEYLYSQVDVADVRAMMNLKVEQTFQAAKVSMESALFGFGGGYKGSKSTRSDVNTIVHNMSEDASEGDLAGAYDAISKLGF